MANAASMLFPTAAAGCCMEATCPGQLLPAVLTAQQPFAIVQRLLLPLPLLPEVL
jgi:hypothetical protein